MGLLDKLFMIDKRAFKKIEKKANRVFLFEDEYSKLSDTDLKGKTEIFKKRLMAELYGIVINEV